MSRVQERRKKRRARRVLVLQLVFGACCSGVAVWTGLRVGDFPDYSRPWWVLTGLSCALAVAAVLTFHEVPTLVQNILRSRKATNR